MKYFIYTILLLISFLPIVEFCLNCWFIISNIIGPSNGLTVDYIFCNLTYAAFLYMIYCFYNYLRNS